VQVTVHPEGSDSPGFTGPDAAQYRMTGVVEIARGITEHGH